MDTAAVRQPLESLSCVSRRWLSLAVFLLLSTGLISCLNSAVQDARSAALRAKGF